MNNNTGSESSPEANDTDITIYTWDNRDRLTSVTHYADYNAYTGTVPYNTPTPDMVVTYTYDLFNRWIGETVTNGGTTTQTRYVYDGNQIVMQFQGTGSGSLQANNLSDRYLWGPAVDQLLADEQVTNGLSQSGNVVWTLTDNQGTVRDLATYDAQTGVTTVANHRVYDSFGNLTSQTNAAVDCLFGFAGLPFDTASGKYPTPTRAYDPATGRWDGEDWIGFMGGDTNLYRYCGNSPTNLTDPIGLASWWIRTNTGRVLSGGEDDGELLNALERIALLGEKIDTMYLKGHGCDEGITTGFKWLSDTYFIKVILDETGHHNILVTDGAGQLVNAFALLGLITDGNTHIVLSACDSYTLAENLSKMLAGVEVEGNHGLVWSFPYVYGSIGVLPGDWGRFKNGVDLNPPPHDLQPSWGP